MTACICHPPAPGTHASDCEATRVAREINHGSRVAVQVIAEALASAHSAGAREATERAAQRVRALMHVGHGDDVD